MIRVLSVFAALALTAAMAAPASAADLDSVTVKLKGKSVATVYADITAAAKTVCKGIQYEPRSPHFGYNCVSFTVADTITTIGSPSLRLYAKSPEAKLALSAS